MTKQEFLYALETALSEELNDIQVNEQINYYRQYIEEQIASGPFGIGGLGGAWRRPDHCP